MERSELVVYAITISGIHPDFYQKRFYGVAFHIDDAICLVQEKALSDGWTDIEYEDITRLGELSFAGWLSKDYDDSNPDSEAQFTARHIHKVIEKSDTSDDA